VVLWDVDAEALGETARRFRELELDVFAEVVDVTDWGAVREAAAKAQADVGPVEVLVNNAGIFKAGLFNDIDFESHARLIEVNVSGQIAVLKAFLPGMIARDSGHVITMASAGSFMPAPRQASYCASKAADLHLVDTLRAELRSAGKKGIRFTSMCPSYVNTTLVTGIKPPLLTSWIDPDDLADAVFRAYLRDRVTVRIPFMAKTVPLLRALLPERVLYVISRLLRLDSSAATWTG
ncbi:MAG: SDR family NAD(P)-dependent oxidoreductase, partial [Actinomycetota bacterium]